MANAYLHNSKVYRVTMFKLGKLFDLLILVTKYLAHTIIVSTYIGLCGAAGV